jgi:benzoyl-CoA reductase/2-hydroxyglutaryl-CoA dehydratase subunit BcrC/BadD/HgdB
MEKLPKNFETYAEARKAGFLKMKALKDAGTRVVGMYCSFVPYELIMAAGAVGVSLCATSEEPIAAADKVCIGQLIPERLKDQYCFRMKEAFQCISFVESEKIWIS